MRREGTVKKFVMDTIYNSVRKEGSRQLKLIEAKFGSTSGGVADSVLIAPWFEMRAIADRVSAEEKNDRKHRDLTRIQDHVAQVFAKHRHTVTKARKKRQLEANNEQGSASFTNLDIEVRQDALRALSKEFFSMKGADELEFSKRERDQLLASCAYWHDSEQKSTLRWTRFPWDVAMRELCDIKAHASGLSKTVASHFYDTMSVKLAPSAGRRH